MNYTVVEAPPVFTDRSKAETLCENMREATPDKDFIVVKRVADIDSADPMEHLYSAAVALAELTQVNPFNLELKLISTGESKSLYRVLEDAREWLDAAEKVQ